MWSKSAFPVQLAISLLTSLLLLAVFPRVNFSFLAPFALSPLLYVLAKTTSGWRRFLLGWISGIVYWFFLCIWIQRVLEVHGGMGQFGSWGAFLLFCLLKGLHLALFSWLAGPLMRTTYAVPAVAALWAGLERTHGTFGFAWLALGNAGIDMSLPLRAAPFVGVYGVSFVFAMMAGGIACVLLRYPRARLYPLLGLSVLYLLPGVPADIKPTDRALVVQPNIDPEADWNPGLQTQTEQQLVALSDAIPSKLVIWPELPAPLYFYSDPEFHSVAERVAGAHQAFLFETVAFNAQQQPLNSAVLLGSNGTQIGRYDQIFLVPFGEFVPPMFSWVNRITKEVSDFVPGDHVQVFPAVGHTLGVFICYESAFPHLVRQFAKAGADVLVNLSNDSYFGHSVARDQHLQLVRMRAVENRRFILP
jgi:apolipoprotein N-acyltransferase